ncbi:MAG: hypothetical protein HY062_05260 [Bacteroidetes bacterium]|nr:hypothetical protein [Bacteroidota bacterium]
MTKENAEHLEAIKDIRQMMKKSTRFLSLSGLSGVFAGIYALAGAVVAYLYLNSLYHTWVRGGESALNRNDIYLNFILIASVVLALSISTAYFFSNRKAKREGHHLFDHAALRVLINLAIPLLAGGVFCMALLYHGTIVYIAPAMLLFYGLALVNASKYTYDDIRYFGICEIVLGLINVFNLGNGLLYWAFGFGVLHIVYGATMWYKYERKG